MNKIRIAVATALLSASAAHASLKIIEKPEGWQLTVGTKVTAHTTYEACKAALAALGDKATGKCKDVIALTVQATCDDEPMPEFPTVIDEHGFTERPGIVIEKLPNSEDWGPMMMQGFVKGPGYPQCWIAGLVPYKEENFNEPEGPADMTPGPWVYTVDPEWPLGGKCPAQKNGLNDPTLCFSPPNPPIPPTK